jgi:hypothetical protein
MLNVWNLVQFATGDIQKFYQKFSTKYFILKVCNIGVVVVVQYYLS